MNGPLAQLKILDFSTLLPGPYASMLMADMGAEVLRIEAIDQPNMVNALQPSHKGNSYAYLTLNRNKQAIRVNLKNSRGIEVIKQLVAQYDIVLEQFRPGVMAKLGLDYQTLKDLNPQLIYCSITGYGQTGCFTQRAGHDINYLALSGLASFSGTEQSGPVLSGTQIADIAGGSHHAVMGILAAVVQRGITGKGQHLDISMTDAAFALNGVFGAGAVGADVDPKLGATPLNGGRFYDYYQTQDGRYLSVGSLEPKFAKAFFDTIGHGDWLERAGSTEARQQQALKADICAVIVAQPLSYWCQLFEPLDACVEPVLSVSEAANSRLLQQRNMVVEVGSMSGDNIKQIAPAIKFSDTRPDAMFVIKPTREYAKDLLGDLHYSADDIEYLIHNRIIN
jgi:alpha-methylacyl-CoA racemase